MSYFGKTFQGALLEAKFTPAWKAHVNDPNVTLTLSSMEAKFAL
jgi:hypothetical protein